jgi:hypothetical protein
MKYRFFTDNGMIWKMPEHGTGWVKLCGFQNWTESVCSLDDMKGIAEISDPDQNAPQSSVEPFKNDQNTKKA